MIEAIDECEVDTSYLSVEENESCADRAMKEVGNELIKQLNEMLIERYAAHGKGLDREMVVRDIISLNRERIKAVREHLSTSERIRLDRLSTSAAVDKLGKELLLFVLIGSSLIPAHSEIMEEIFQGLMAELSFSSWPWESLKEIGNELIKQLNEMLIERYAAHGKGLDRDKVVRDIISLNREKIIAVIRELLSPSDRIMFDCLPISDAVDKFGKNLLLLVPIGPSLKLEHSEIMEEIFQGLMAELSSALWTWESLLSSSSWTSESFSPINFQGTVEVLMAFRARTADLVNKWSSYIIRSQASHENSIHADFLETARKCEIVRNTHGGASGSYFMQDGEGVKHFVIKPIDEDINAYNNPNYPHLFCRMRMSFEMISRRAFPLAQIDTMAYQVAKIVGIPGATPEATMMVVKSGAFHDVGTHLSTAPASQKVKLCSVQRFVQGARNWSQVRNRLLREKLSLEEMKERVDFEEFESANLLMWILGETDGHGGNVLGYPREDGKWGVKKIDSGLAFPTRKRRFFNGLSSFPLAEEALSSRAKRVIKNIDLGKIVSKMVELELEASIPLLVERVRALQEWAREESITIREIDQRMRRLMQ